MAKEKTAVKDEAVLRDVSKLKRTKYTTGKGAAGPRDVSKLKRTKYTTGAGGVKQSN